MKISVTQTDIHNARVSKGEILACPIFQACKRIFGDKILGVSRRYIWLRDGTSYLLSREATDFTLAADRKEVLKPFSFEAKES
jgi:hypothetical protein